MDANTLRLKAQHARIIWGGFYRCPNTQRIIEALHGDDKAQCNCGRSNPRVPQEQTERTGVHIIRFLQSVSAEDYVREKEETNG